MSVQTYCDKPDSEILDDILSRSVPAWLLLDKEGWERICQVRARNISSIDRETWKELYDAHGSKI
jgi:hypothetical protein